MKPNECKHCGARIPQLIFGNGFAFRCTTCGSQTKTKPTFDLAVQAWNEGDFEWVEINPAVRELVEMNDGHCPCAIFRSEDTICPCADFRAQENGTCNCGKFKKAVKKNE